jgi:hypothetical protein
MDSLTRRRKIEELQQSGQTVALTETAAEVYSALFEERLMLTLKYFTRNIEIGDPQQRWVTSSSCTSKPEEANR